jgi:type I restriction enzyme, S subunit
MSEQVWAASRLSDIALAIKDGSHGTHRRVANGIPFLSAKNVTDQGLLDWGDSDDRISEEDYRAISASFSPHQDDLLLTIVGSLGRRALFDGARVAFQRSVAFVRPELSRVKPRFLFHAVASADFARQLVRRSNATAQAGLYLGELAKTTVPLPPIAEQSRIAAVLDTVDEAIAKTEAVIAKLKQVHAGLLHDLLTRGLDEHGQLRDPIAHPEQFQESPLLGQIPREWGIKTLRQLTDFISYGFTNPMPTTRDGPWMLTAFDIGVGEIRYDQARHTSQDAFDSLLTEKSKPRVGDILVTKDGTLGRVAIVDREGVCINQSVAVLRPQPTTDTENVVQFLRSPAGQSAMLAEVGGSTIKHIYITKLADLLVPYPSTREQTRIVEVLAGSEIELLAESRMLAKFCLLKSGLMTDLLTGRVRVPEGIMVAS